VCGNANDSALDSSLLPRHWNIRKTEIMKKAIITRVLFQLHISLDSFSRRIRVPGNESSLIS
jgi:hypothetical protein